MYIFSAVMENICTCNPKSSQIYPMASDLHRPAREEIKIIR